MISLLSGLLRKNEMDNIRQWLEDRLQPSNQRGNGEILQKELSVTVEELLRIQLVPIDPWTEPLLTFDLKRLENQE